MGLIEGWEVEVNSVNMDVTSSNICKPSGALNGHWGKEVEGGGGGVACRNEENIHAMSPVLVANIFRCPLWTI